MITILIIILTLIIGVLTYLVINLSKKNSLYEQAIQGFYEDTSIVLHAMRVLDEKRMFETDDEVGFLFQQLTEIIGTLRPLLYGNQDDEN